MEYGQEALAHAVPRRHGVCTACTTTAVLWSMSRASSSMHTSSNRSKLAEMVETPELLSTSLSVFLQVDREVKWNLGRRSHLCVCSLWTSSRAILALIFSPTIYVRDPSSGVQYEIEDIDEIKEKCLLSLNIECKSFSFYISWVVVLIVVWLALDQIKQHIDAQI